MKLESIFPGFRNLNKSPDYKFPRIEVGADCLGLGKTTAVEVLSKGLKAKGCPVKASYELAGKNPYLKRSYEDPFGVLLKSQKWFIKAKHRQLSQAAKRAVFIQDVHPEMDFNYALTNKVLGRLSKSEFDDYVQYFNSLGWDKVVAPDLLVYLTTNDTELLRRVRLAGEVYEKVRPSYYLTMKQINQAWLNQARKVMNVLEVETEGLDFAHDRRAKKQLVEMVWQELTKLGWELEAIRQRVELLTDQQWKLLKQCRLILMSGLPGCGKSYLAKKICQQVEGKYLSSDRVRLKRVLKNEEKFLWGADKYVKTRETVYQLLHDLALKAIAKDKLVVIDATYLGPQREAVLRLLEQEGLKKQAVFVVVKANEGVIQKRVKLKKRRLKSGRKYEAGWAQAYYWFVDKLKKREIYYPSEKKDGVRVIEVWNQ